MKKYKQQSLKSNKTIGMDKLQNKLKKAHLEVNIEIITLIGKNVQRRKNSGRMENRKTKSSEKGQQNTRKILVRIILDRIKEMVEIELRNNQAGFRS